jgi:hypothetical protein
MWTWDGTFGEAVSLISGFDAAGDGGLLAGFRPWLLERTGNPRPELAWPSLIFEYAFPDVRHEHRSRSTEEDAIATKALFALLDEYLASHDG